MSKWYFITWLGGEVKHFRGERKTSYAPSPLINPSSIHKCPNMPLRQCVHFAIKSTPGRQFTCNFHPLCLDSFCFPLQLDQDIWILYNSTIIKPFSTILVLPLHNFLGNNIWFMRNFMFTSSFYLDFLTKSKNITLKSKSIILLSVLTMYGHARLS